MKKENKKHLGRRQFLKKCAKAVCTGLLLSFVEFKNVWAKQVGNGDKSAERKYAMGIDIHKCIGCGRCADACKKENKVPREPHYFRTWIERYIVPIKGEPVVDSPNGGIDGFPELKGDKGILKMFFVPKLCNHCAHPPCVQVCPVGATFTSRDGVVLVDPKYCVGCRYCIQACPYGARYMHPEKHVADKCTFCYHRITKGLLPACVEVCPTKARIFGEVDNPTSPIRRFARLHTITVLKPSLNTEPMVLYAGAEGMVR